jgi:hypothetical protein
MSKAYIFYIRDYMLNIYISVCFAHVFIIWFYYQWAPQVNVRPPPSANMCMGDGTLLLLAGNSKQRCHQCANILGPTGQTSR